MESLVPADADVIQREDGACVELAPHPDCTTLAFYLDAPLPERERVVAAAADRNGWTLQGVLHGTGFLTFDNGEFRAHVHLLDDPRNTCDGRPPYECSPYVDTIRVSHGA